MRGVLGSAAIANRDRAERRRARDGWISVAVAAVFAERPPATIQSWIAQGRLPVEVMDNRRYVNRTLLKALVKRMKPFRKGSVSAFSIHVIAIQCDDPRCSTIWAGDAGAAIEQVRQEAEEGGDWRRVGDRDLCGEHRPEE